ncbi:hypothetical protein SAMN02745165_03018 [Malonomonas rubra DSM 5091]|uniref:Helix-turn-helix domain-containing protein n=1 Tax=Malonomonas rubra DSM 5091 TaxID=1122189 RepID=A0A1M6LMZ5_MALRU|nr:hypothetical protein [Malonomonas rubra]SHJ72581.1 hypothetical protein SAMN02745165_03018 [Malonomonas rubra DSM 5091]
MTTEIEKLTVDEVATTMKTTPVNVMMHIKRGLLAGEEIDGSWYVAADSLASYLNDANRGHNGSVCKAKSHCGGGCSSSCG